MTSLDRAKRLVERVRAGEATPDQESFVFDVAVQHGQIFDNVAHTEWLVEAVDKASRTYSSDAVNYGDETWHALVLVRS
jgi:hypothetical protein